jgi:hypothetical protein
VIAIVESERSSWTAFHVRAEALRQVRAAGVALDQSDQAVDRIVAHALSPQWSMPITTQRTMPVEPPRCGAGMASRCTRHRRRPSTRRSGSCGPNSD